MKKFFTFKSLTKMVKGLFAVMMITFMAFGNVFAQSYQYKLVTENQTDWSGTYLLASAVTGTSSTSYYAFSGFSTTATVYGLGTDISNVVIGDSITSNSTTDAYQVTITKTLSNTYTISRNGEFLGWTSGNSLAHSASASSNKYEWNLSVNDGVLSITNANTPGRKLQWNANSPRFACYTSGQTPCRLYKKVVLDPNAIATPIFTPVAGLYYNTQTVAIATATTGATIYYTTDGTTPDETSAVYSEPITVSINTTIKAIAIKNDNESFVAEANYSFPEAFTSVSNLKANAVNNEVYRLNAALRVIYQNGQNLFVQDNTGALLVYGNVGKTYNPGDYIYGGIYGKYTIYNGLKEFAVVADAPAMADGEAGSAIAPVVVTVADLLANYDQYESKLVTVQNVTFTGGRNFTQNGSSMVYYNGFNISNLPASIDAGRIGNVTGIVNKYNSTIQLYPRSGEDIEIAAELPLTVDFDENPAEGWVINNGTATNKWYIGQAQGFDNNKLYISSTNGATNKYANSTSTVTASRYINVPATGAKLTFDCRVNGENGSDYVRVKLDNQILGTYSSINEWENQTIDFTPAMAGTHTLAFEWHNDGSVANQFAAAIDNINIVPVTCTQPSNLVATVNATTATITWDAPADQTAWTVEYKLANHTDWYSIPVTVNTITLSDLQGNSNYDVRVKANCGDESSVWTVGTFAIDCQNEVIGTATADVTIGTGTTSNSNLPFYGLYNYTYSQQIFDAAEINASNGMVYSISFYCLTAPRSGTTGGIRIWLGNTTKSTFNSNTDYVNPSELTQVYYNASNYNYTTGWNTFVFDQPFVYDGTKNLVVAYYEGNSSYNSGAFQVHSTNGNKSISHYNDNASNVSYSSPATASGSKYFNPYRNNIKLNMDVTTIVCGDVESCPTVTNVAVSNITATGAEVSWTPANQTQTEFIVEYKAAADAAWTVANVSSANNYVITGLNQLTNYTVRVLANCGTNDLSEAAVANFSTLGICPMVSNISHTNTSTVTALNWTAGSDEAAWTIQFKPVAAGDNAWVTLNASIIPMTTFGGLEGNTEYVVRIKALCDPEDSENQSDWAYYYFTSGCAAFEVPMAELFNQSYEPTCWTSDGFTFNGTTASANSVNNWLMTPPVNIPSGAANYFVSFDVTPSGTYTLMASDRGSAIARFATIYTGTANDTKAIVAIPESYKGKMVYFMIMNGVNNWITVDNLKINECPYIPTDLQATNITDNSISITWNCDAAVSNWIVEYSADGQIWNSVAAAANNATITGLDANTAYQLRVKSACNATASGDASSVLTVTTACSLYNLPYEEDFEGFTSSTSWASNVMPDCWSVYKEGTSTTYYPSIYRSSTYAHSGMQAARFYNYCTSSSQTSATYGKQYMVLPKFNVSNPKVLMINGWARRYSTTASYNSDVTVGVCTDLNNFEATFTPVTHITAADATYRQFSIDLGAYNGADGYVVFFMDRPTGSPTYNTICIDDIVVDLAPTCFPVSDLAVASVADVNATLTWTDSRAQGGYVVAYRAEGEANWIYETVATTSANLTNLLPSTTYEAKVKAACADETESDYTNVITFTTNCLGGLHAEIGNGTTGSSYLPSQSYYNYSLTQQIYDAAEIGNAGPISQISIYNQGSAKTRTYAIYLKHTTKSSFASTTDWETVTNDDKLFSGSVTMNANEWTVITLDRTFNFNGSDNVVMVFDDNTGNYSSGLSGRCTSMSTYKSLYVYSDGTNYNPASPSSYTGTRIYPRMNVVFNGCREACPTPSAVAVTNINANGANVSWTSNGTETEWNVQYGPAGFALGTGTTVQATATSLTLTGLNPSTAYDVYVQAACSASELSEWTDAASFSTPCENACTYVVSMADQYDDSWNGASINIYQNGSLVNNITCAYGEETVETIIACPGEITFAWSSGSYDSECSFEIKDGEGQTLYSCTDGSSLSSGNFYTAYCGSIPTCFTPAGLAVSNITSSTADIDWIPANGETDFVVEYTEAEVENWIPVTVTANSTTLSNLVAGTEYLVRVKANCGEGDESDYSAEVSFRTPCSGGADLTLGNGTYSDAMPFNTCYKNSKSENIYSADEIGVAGEITSMAWDFTGTTAHTPSELKIYLGTTTRSEYASTADWTPTSDLTLVYSSTSATIGGNTGWQSFSFDTPFNYDGASNLVVVVTRKASNYNCTASSNATTMGGNISLYRQNDSDEYYGDVNNATSGTFSTNRPNIKFGICPKAVDLALTNINTTPDACEINMPVSITVANNGVSAAVTTFDAYYSINGGEEVHEVVTLAQPLAYQASTTYTFSQVPTYVTGSNVITARVEIANDEADANNTITSSEIVLLDPIAVPYFENFAGVTINHGWNPIDANNDGVSMNIDNAITYTYSDVNAANDWMFSPCINLPAGVYNVSYTYKANSPLTESFEVYYGAAPDVVNMTNLVGSYSFNSASDGEVTETITVAQDGVYNFGFKATSGVGNLGFSIYSFNVTPVVNVNVVTAAHGTASPAGEVGVNYGGDLTLTIIPDEMYHVGGIWVDGTQVMNEDPFNANFMLYTLENVTEPHTINIDFKLEFHIIKSVENYNLAYTDEPGYFIPAATDTLIDPNPYTVTFAPTAHYHFVSLEMGAMSLDNPMDVTADVIDNGNGTYSYTIDTLVIANYYLNAIFRRDTVNIHYNILTGQGTVDASDNLVAPAQYDTWVDFDKMGDLTETINITPAANYHIVNVNINGNDMGVINTYTFSNVTTTQNVNVKFGYEVNASIRNYANSYLGSNNVRGTIAPATQLVPEFDPFTVSGTIEEHFHLYNFLVNGVDRINEVVFDGQNYSFTMSSTDNNYDIEAVVKIDTFGLYYTVQGGNGVIDNQSVVDGGQYVTMLNYGDNFLSTFAAAPGYHIESITIDGVNYGNIDSWQYDFISGVHHIVVVYAPNSIVINTTAYGNGTVTDGETFLYDPARTYTFTATPAQGYHIASILHNDETVDVADPEDGYTETLTNIVENHNYVTRFEMNTYNITATAGANGAISPAGVTAYNYAANATYSINAELGYYIASVTVDGVTTNYAQADAMNSTVVTFNNITEAHTVAATFAQYQYTITVNAGTNGAITPATATYAFGATPAFTITPNAGYGIVDVTVDNASVGAVENYTFTALTADHVIAATFAQYEYTITATAGTNGSITPAGVTNMVHGGNQSYTITPATGYYVQDVFVDGASVGAVTSYSFTGVTANHTIYAMFAANEYTVTVNQPAHGTITPGTMTVTYGATPTFVVTPDMGYSVATITLNGSNVMNAATNVNDVYTYTLPAVTANATVSATMSAKTYTITATAGAHGTVTPAGATTVNYGANQAYVITPADGYVVDKVLVDGINMGAIGAYTFVNVVANHTINATFKFAECEVPTNMHVINIDTTSATLTWYHPSATSFDIQYKALNEATYTIISDVTGNSYELTDLQPSTSYVWNITANCAAGNYSETSNGQIFTTMSLPVPPAIDTTGVENYVQNLVKVYSYENNIFVVNDNNVNISNIQVYDIYGQLLYNGRANSNPEVISMNVATGTYMVRLTTDKGICNYKLYLR